MSKKFKAFVSKWALTDGIIEANVELVSKEFESILVQSQKYTYVRAYFHGEGKDWHRTKEEAIKKANELLNKKINSLEKQLKKFKAMTFNSQTKTILDY